MKNEEIKNNNLISISVYKTAVSKTFPYQYPDSGSLFLLFEFQIEATIGSSERKLIGHLFYRQNSCERPAPFVKKKMPPRGTTY
jgi:hypothetical protein